MTNPVISAKEHLRELTPRVVILGLILAAISAASSTFLALKIGVLTASSIPAAMIAMGLLSSMKQSSLLECNCVQTAASAGEAVAGGIVYTAPGLVIIHTWYHFPYFETVLLTLIGGLLGVVFTIPLRRSYMQTKALRFPEAQAIAQVLISGLKERVSLAPLIIGAIMGAFIECLQTGVRLIANGAQLWWTEAGTTFGFGAGFSTTLLAAGYLIGFDVGLSILIGSVIANGFCVPILSNMAHAPSLSGSVMAHHVLDNQVRYIGIAAMLATGLITLVRMLKPIGQSLMMALKVSQNPKGNALLRTQKDLSYRLLLAATAILCVAMYFVFDQSFNLNILTQITQHHVEILLFSLALVLLLGFLFSAICAYFSGLVGVAASPGSSVAIATVLIFASLWHLGMVFFEHPLTSQMLHQGIAITIIMTCVVMGSAAVANNNSQDLKVGYILGATPWKQQIMLAMGTLVAALIVPWVMQMLFHAYGIAGVHAPGANPHTQTLPAPPAAAMAAIAAGMMHASLPKALMFAGLVITLVFFIAQLIIGGRIRRLSLIGVAIGIYLPLYSSTALFIGALIARWIKGRSQNEASRTRAMMGACGILAGAALMNVVIAPTQALINPRPAYTQWLETHHGLSMLLGLGVIVFIVAFLNQQRQG